LILVEPEFLVINDQTILGVRGVEGGERKPKPEKGVMFPLAKGLTLCMILESPAKCL